ncbi:MAG: hypothetical protein IKK51_02770 [Oscillospiraceae bacterium]|nr:hypothetical protein [Oscillospiraceae bacterium]MBR4100789.1 hypothetical protein [Oscillospiraceae bacterium]
MKVLYTTGKSMYLAENGKEIELPSYRAMQYRQTIEEIQQNKLWKTTGRGAQFMGVAPADTRVTDAVIGGVALYQEHFLYTLQLDASGGIYRRSFSEKPQPEGHIYSGNDIRPGDLAVHEENLATCVHYPNGAVHLALFRLPSSVYTVITDGDSCERNPRWSHDGRLLYFSTAGIARENGLIAAYSPRAAACYNINTDKMEMLIEDEKHDILSPCEDAQGNLWYIRQPYHMQEKNKGNTFLSALKDVLLFPFWLVKALFGFLNAFSILFGGKPAADSGMGSDLKSRQKSDKELFFEGRMLDAEKNLKANKKSGDPYAGIMSASRVLVRRASDGTEEVLAKGVLDYALCGDGGVVYSNGSHILHRKPDGTVENIVKTRMAARLQVVNN